MKKLTTMFLGILVALCAVAAPQVKVSKVNSFVKSEKKVVRKAAKALQEATNVNILSLSTEYSSEYSEYLYVLAADDRYFIFAFAVTEDKDPVEVDKDYTLSDMAEAYWFISNFNYADFTACTFKKTVDANGKVKIVATATDEDGAEWSLLYDEASLPDMPQGGTFTADEVSGKNWGTDIQYSLSIEAIKAEIYVDILLNDGEEDVESGKKYTLADMDADYTGISVYKNNIEFTSLEFTKTVATDGSYTVVIVIVDKNGNTWTINASKAAPKVVEKTLTLNGTSEVGSDMSQIEAADEDTTVYVSFLIWEDHIAGDWTTSDMYYPSVWFRDGTDTTFYDIETISINVAWDEANSNYKLTGTAKAVNEDDDLDIINITFNLTIKGDAPVVHKATTAEFTMKDMKVNVNDSYWDLQGENADKLFLEIRSLSADIAGNYTEKNLDDYYTYIGAGNSVYYDIFKANVTVTYENMTIAVKGNITFVDASSKDTIYATIDVAGVTDGKSHLDYDEQSGDFIVDFPNPTINTDYVADDGILYVMATNDDKTTITLEFNVAKTATGLAAGEYAINTTGAEGTINAGSGIVGGYINGSFAGIRNANNNIDKIWWIVSGKATVAANGVITLEAVNTYDKQIKCVIGKDESMAVENVENVVKAVKTIENGQLLINRDGKTYNVMGAIVR